MSGEAKLAAMARDALPHWGGGTILRQVSLRENAVFEAELKSGARVALRLHRPGYQSRASIEAELVWVSDLARAGVPVAAPLPCVNGRMTVRMVERLVSAVAWVEGAPLVADRHARMAEIGALARQLHSNADRLPAPARPAWDAEALLGAVPRWGKYWENPALSAADQALILRARARAASVLSGYDFGPIHADLMGENILATPQGLALIDFDDSGSGYRFYDLASAVIQSFEAPDWDAVCDAILRGYGAGTRRDLDLFVMLRAFASAGWVMSRTPSEDPRRPLYAARATRAAARFLEAE